MFLRRTFIACVVLFPGVAPCAAAGAGPGTAPAGAARGAAKVDLTSPKETAKSLFRALEAGDGSAVRAVFQADPGPESELADTFAALLVAGKQLGEAAKAKFGGEGDKIGAPMMSKEQLADIDAGEVKVEGDSATLVAAGQSRPMKFKQAGGAWRLVVTDYARALPDELPRQVALLKEMTAVMTASAADLADGKFATPQEAEAAMVQKFNAVMINATQQAPPTTGPASPPPAK